MKKTFLTFVSHWPDWQPSLFPRPSRQMNLFPTGKISVVSVNREEPRSAFMTYANKTQALTGDYEKVLTTSC